MADIKVELDTKLSDESIQQKDIQPETESKENLQSWLGKIALKEYFNKMKECGLTSVSHLEDIHTEDAAVKNFGMMTFQARRLLREFNEWKTTKFQSSKKRKEHHPQSSIPGLITNNDAVSLPPSFQGFFGTRWRQKCRGSNKSVGQKVVKSSNPVQTLSNRFVLRMCESQQYKFK